MQGLRSSQPPAVPDSFLPPTPPSISSPLIPTVPCFQAICPQRKTHSPPSLPFMYKRLVAPLAPVATSVSSPSYSLASLFHSNVWKLNTAFLAHSTHSPPSLDGTFLPKEIFYSTSSSFELQFSIIFPSGNFYIFPIEIIALIWLLPFWICWSYHLLFFLSAFNEHALIGFAWF